MKTFLKTLIGGALGLGSLYVVGKICYEMGKGSAEVEQQLEISEDRVYDNTTVKPVDETPVVDADRAEYWRKQEKDIQKIFDDAKKAMAEGVDQEVETQSFFNRCISKAKNAKIFLTAKKAFDKKGRGPGILSSLLTNPDGAKIEACVKDGGVIINVKPRGA